MKYQIVVAGSQHLLQKQVQELIDQGWRPQGGVAMTISANWMQAMVLVQ